MNKISIYRLVHFCLILLSFSCKNTSEPVPDKFSTQEAILGKWHVLSSDNKIYDGKQIGGGFNDYRRNTVWDFLQFNSDGTGKDILQSYTYKFGENKNHLTITHPAHDGFEEVRSEVDIKNISDKDLVLFIDETWKDAKGNVHGLTALVVLEKFE